MVDPPDDEHNMARNMQRNMKRYNKQVHQVGNMKSNITKTHGQQHTKICPPQVIIDNSTQFDDEKEVTYMIPEQSQAAAARFKIQNFCQCC